MIQLQTTFKIFDNSGVKQVRCIRVEKRHAKKCIGSVGDTVLGVVLRVKKKLKSKITYKKGDIVRVLLVSTKKETPLNKTGIYFKNVKDNCGLLVQPTKQNKQILLPIASRFDGYLPRIFKKNTANLAALTSLYVL